MVGTDAETQFPQEFMAFLALYLPSRFLGSAFDPKHQAFQRALEEYPQDQRHSPSQTPRLPLASYGPEARGP